MHCFSVELSLKMFDIAHAASIAISMFENINFVNIGINPATTQLI
jgi:hypothetical protein